MSVPDDPGYPDIPADNPYLAPQAVPEGIRFVPPSDEELNPWLSIWTRPRATIRQIVETDPTYMILPLAALGGIGRALDNASARSVGDQLSLSAILGIAVMAGPIAGVIGLYVSAAVLRWTGKLLGGIADVEQVRAAVAWSQMPLVVGLLLWVPQLALFGSDMFTTDMPTLAANPSLAPVLMAIGVTEIVLGVFQLVILVKCLGEVHGFSAWKGFGSLMLAGLLLVAIVVIPLVILFVALGGPG